MADEQTSRPPAVLADADSEPFWKAAQQRRLRIQSCAACERLTFPPKACCPNCLGPLDWQDVSGKGHVYSYTIARLNVVSGYNAPYAVAWISLVEQEDIRLTTNIIGCPLDEITIGMRVEVTFEDRAGALVVPQFRPVPAGQGC